MSDFASVNLDRLLTTIERAELPLLSWGVVDASFTEEELLETIEKTEPKSDPDDLLDRLIDRRLVVQTSDGRYRSRMAETLRLNTQLRQWFPGKPWDHAPSLVSDFRFASAPRTVPSRVIGSEQLMRRLGEIRSDDLSSEMKSTLERLVGNRQLSEFQLDATDALLNPSESSAATCIAAGTGAGKTLAFYLPALTRLLTDSRARKVPFVVGIYPRVELLRDQLAALVDLLLETGTVGDVRVGPLFGKVPRDRQDAEKGRYRKWNRTAEGLVCPYLTCRAGNCEGEYVWPDSAKESNQLLCMSCGHELTNIVLTRRSMTRKPPEILFATTEMVNGALDGGQLNKLVVGLPKQRPQLLLLDEVHTYEGVHGAQVAGLLRRWLSATFREPHVVGLSATLADPAGFMAQLVGTSTDRVRVVAPRSKDLDEVSGEYHLALRGDPASQTALLSTTIQTAMLQRRMLDTDPAGPSEKTYGSKVFLFADSLDVANRLHTQLLDAEGWKPNGVDHRPGMPLAHLRQRGDDNARRDRAGQLWDFSQNELGTLLPRVKIGITSSQNSGVDKDARVVVATASLDVGFDDPDVGAVIQHKAPRGAAQFVQRRGRAGRQPLMRPWTTIVLSDYGRDRIAFQSYEQLFDPIVPAVDLPVRNLAVLKMQATWWLRDDMAIRLRDDRWWNPGTAVAASKALDVALGLLEPDSSQRIQRCLRGILGIDDDLVEAVLWDAPRGLFSTVVPTLIRTLTCIRDGLPAPEMDVWAEFLPTALFQPLQTPEVDVIDPVGGSESENRVGAALALREFAPGRVNYRFAKRGKWDRQWIPAPGRGGPLIADDFLDASMPIRPPRADSIRLLQPTRIRVSNPSQNVPDKSFGSWEWRSRFEPTGSNIVLTVPKTSSWAAFVLGMDAYVQRFQGEVTVWRYADSCRIEPGDNVLPSWYSAPLKTAEGEKVAVGFSQVVDGVRLSLDLSALRGSARSEELERGLRSTFFEHSLVNDSELIERTTSSFARDWLALLAISATALRKSRNQGDLASASDSELRNEFRHVAVAVFGVGTNDNGDDDDVPLVQELDLVLMDRTACDAIRRCLPILAAPSGDEFVAWMERRFAITLGAAVRDAIQFLRPDLNTEDLVVDVETADAATSTWSIWLTEESPGGAGVLEAAVEAMSGDPRAFWALVESAVGPTLSETTEFGVRRLLELRAESDVRGALDRVRASDGLVETSLAWDVLRSTMQERFIHIDPSMVSVLATRMLRSGTGRETEDLIDHLFRKWDEIEGSLGAEVELRTLAYICAVDEELAAALDRAAGRSVQDITDRVGLIVGLLTPRGSKVRASSLQVYNRYSDLLGTERLLVTGVLEADRPTVDGALNDWRDLLDEKLNLRGRADVLCPDEDRAATIAADLLTSPTEVGVLEFHPRVVGVDQSQRGLVLRVDLREAVQ